MAVTKKQSIKRRERLELKLSRKPIRKWLVTGFFALVLVFMVVGALRTAMTLADSQVDDPNPIAGSVSPNEITGTSSEAVKKLQDIINSDNQTFIYFYEPNCERCSKSEPVIFSSAEKKGITVYRFNVKKYKKALDLKNENGVRLVSFYKTLPVVGYYNKGWLIAWADGDQSKEVYDDFYDHFRFGDAHDHKQ